MPNRAEMLCPPEAPYARAQWLDAHWLELLEAIPMDQLGEGWGCLERLEAALFPLLPRASELLGGPLDPACPTCGVETDEGTVTKTEAGFRVKYDSCGHELDMNEADLLARVQVRDARDG